MRSAAWIAIATVTIAACKDKAPAPASSAPPPAVAHDAKVAEVAVLSDAALAKPATPPKPPLVVKDVQALLDAWLAAQNGGTFDGYAALYGDPFKGVRRTGKKVVRLDRAGWLADRKKMFARPMVVAMAHVVIAPAPGRALVTFEQTWSTGKFRDVGPKSMTIVETPGGLRIASEELLASRIVPAVGGDTLASTLWLGWQGRVVLANELGTAKLGKLALLDGELVERDPECDTDPPDYEGDNTRYFQCLQSKPELALDTYKAKADVTASSLPPALATLVGAELVGYDAQGVACTGIATAVEAYGERYTSNARITETGRKDRDLATAVLDAAGALVTTIDGCAEVTFARPAGKPAPVMWKLAEATGAVAAPYLTALEAHPEFGTWEEEGPEGEPTRKVQIATSPDGTTRYVIATIAGVRDCSTWGFVGVVWRERGNTRDDLFVDAFEDFDLVAVADLEGDGRPELVLTDGFILDEAGEYNRVVAFEPVDEVGACLCDVEGFGCAAN